MTETQLPEAVPRILDDFLPVLQEWWPGACAVALGGSRAKGLADSGSDLDFRYYYSAVIDDGDRQRELEAAYRQLLATWEKRGHVIDGFWCRPIARIEDRLEAQLTGVDITPEPLFWSVWGYELLTDIHCQIHILDPDGVLQRWSDRLAQYPQPLKQAVVSHYLPMLTYWRDDYHYVNKLRRDDFLFAEGLALKLINGLIRILFALNEVYYVGDGNNLRFVGTLGIIPDGFVERIGEILHRGARVLSLMEQRQLLVQCIDEVEALAEGVTATS